MFFLFLKPARKHKFLIWKNANVLRQAACSPRYRWGFSASSISRTKAQVRRNIFTTRHESGWEMTMISTLFEFRSHFLSLLRVMSVGSGASLFLSTRLSKGYSMSWNHYTLYQYQSLKSFYFASKTLTKIPFKITNHVRLQTFAIERCSLRCLNLLTFDRVISSVNVYVEIQ